MVFRPQSINTSFNPSLTLYYGKDFLDFMIGDATVRLHYENDRFHIMDLGGPSISWPEKQFDDWITCFKIAKNMVGYGQFNRFLVKETPR